MKKCLLAVTACLIVLSQAKGSIPGLANGYFSMLSETRRQMTSQNLLAGELPQTCHAGLYELYRKDTMNITVAFGYMDSSAKPGYVARETDLFGPGSVTDLDARTALERMFTSRCGSHYFACGFSKSGSRLTKRIRNRFTGQNMTVNIDLFAPAISGSDSHNQTSAAQEARSASVRAAFLSSFQTADAVLYLGHARSGGGPDFYPPELYGNGSVNYNYYQAREGLRSMERALGNSPNKPSVIGLLACKSTNLFSRSIKRLSPRSVVVSAGDLFDFIDIIPTGYAMVEAIVSQRCAPAFDRAIRVQPNSARFIDGKY